MDLKVSFPRTNVVSLDVLHLITWADIENGRFCTQTIQHLRVHLMVNWRDDDDDLYIDDIEGFDGIGGVDGVRALDCHGLKKIPCNLIEFFPNMTILEIRNCGIRKISRNDFRRLKTLKEIALHEMEIEELPSDVFTDLVNLEVIDLKDNEIKFIGKETFKHLNKLKFVNLTGNPLISVLYDVDNSKYHEFEKGVRRVFKLDEFNTIIDGLCDKQPLGSTLKVQDSIVIILYTANTIRRILTSDDFNDFSIKIDENEFKVHKLMLAARSPTLAEMIKNNPDADELILTDINVAVFKIILAYIYNDKMPEEYDGNSTKLFMAAGRLKLEPLTSKVGDILCTAVDSNNCFEMLKLASKFNHENLKRKSFEELKKVFPGQSFKDELIDNLEMLQKMIDAKRAYEDKLKQVQEEFEKFITK